MRSTKIVTSFITNDSEILIVKRSNKVKSMKGLWAGISGIIEKNEEPLARAKTEILEEAGIAEDRINLISSADMIRMESPQYRNHEWEIFPFLFEVKSRTIELNWENSEYMWIQTSDLKKFKTVPGLERVLLDLL